MKYRFEFMTLTQLGEIFGVSSHKVGDWLVELGFRTENKRPSKLAFEADVVKEGPSRGQGYNWIWHAEKTIEAIEAAGHKRTFPAPLGLVEAPILCGPFTLISDSTQNFRVENRDQDVVLQGQGNGGGLLTVMNAAHRLGYFQRNLLQSSKDDVHEHGCSAKKE